LLVSKVIDVTFQTVFITLITLVALCSVVTGLDKSVKRLSEFNIVLALLFMTAVIVLGSTLDFYMIGQRSTGHGFYLKVRSQLSSCGVVD